MGTNSSPEADDPVRGLAVASPLAGGSLGSTGQVRLTPLLMATATATLAPRQARVLLRAEQAVAAAQIALTEAKQERDKVRERYADRVPVGEEFVVAGIRVKRVEKSSGRSFKLRDYLEKHKLTAAMRPFVKDGSPYELWIVKEAESG